ncbi:MAG: RnfH family protein [Burkholderiales bacterium]
MGEMINVEVVYALPERQWLVQLSLPQGCTALDAVKASGVCAVHGELDLPTLRLGVFSRPVAADTPLRERDRVEIYRSLIADPKVSRRQRADNKAARKTT